MRSSPMLRKLDLEALTSTGSYEAARSSGSLASADSACGEACVPDLSPRSHLPSPKAEACVPDYFLPAAATGALPSRRRQHCPGLHEKWCSCRILGGCGLPCTALLRSLLAGSVRACAPTFSCSTVCLHIKRYLWIRTDCVCGVQAPPAHGSCAAAAPAAPPWRRRRSVAGRPTPATPTTPPRPSAPATPAAMPPCRRRRVPAVRIRFLVTARGAPGLA